MTFLAPAHPHHAHGRVTIAALGERPDSPEILVEKLPHGTGYTLRLPHLGRTCGRFATEADALRAAARSGFRVTLPETGGAQ